MWKMPKNPKECIAGTRERVDHHKLIGRHTCGDRSNVATNTITERITSTLHCGATEKTYSTPVPFSRRHSVNADVVGVAEAVQSVLLNFRKTQHFIAF